MDQVLKQLPPARKQRRKRTNSPWQDQFVAEMKKKILSLYEPEVLGVVVRREPEARSPVWRPVCC